MIKGTPNGGIKGTLANGLLAHWCFNDGDLTDQSGNGRDLVCINTQVNVTDKDGIANNAVNCYNDSYYKTNDLNHPLFGLTEWTICMWVNFKSYTNNEGFFTIKPDASGHNGTWSADTAKSMSVNGATITRPANGWHFIIWERLSTGYCRFYIDGTVYEVPALSITSNNNDLIIGKRSSFLGRYPNADFDEISMYNRALTADERAELYDMGVNYAADTEPPIFNTINISNITYNSIKVNVNCNENATAYYKLYNKNEMAPTSEQLRTSHDGEIALTANNLVTENITGLTALKDYDLYVVAEDVVGNLQAAPSLLQFNASYGKTATPTASLPSGIYENDIMVVLSCIAANAEIRFTTDGSEPTEISQLYLEPLIITESATIKAKAFKTGYTESDTLSLNYTITTGGESMNTIYFGDDDIKVRISSEKAFKGGNLNKVIVVTNENIVPLAVFSGNGGNEALELYLASTLDVAAPKLQEAVKKLLMQVDNDGNPVIPEYFYVIGHNVTATLEANLLAAADACDYYGIVPVFQNDGFVSNILTDICVPKHRVVIASDTAKVLSYTNKSDRLIAIYDPTEEYKNAAWTGRVLQYDSFIGWKWKNLAGCTADGLTDTEQLAAKNSGLNYYKMIRGVANTSGSLSAKSENSTAYHIDEVIAKDIIISNVATSLLEMFQKNEIISLGFAGKIEVEKAIRVALIYCGNLGLIERNEDGSYQFTVTVPDITAEMRQSRKLIGVKFSYVLAVNMEQIVVDGLELLELIEGGSN